jgi:hypothetical protein
MEILAQFLLRLAFGLAVGMAITPPQKVSSGFFRNHLYVALGLTTLAALTLAPSAAIAASLAAAAALLSFFAAACWLYEAPRPGTTMLWLVAACALAAALYGQALGTTGSEFSVWRSIAVGTSGLSLGMVLAAMLLGHWYLNAPGMELAPLRRLLAAAAIALCAQAFVSGVGLAAEVSSGPGIRVDWLLFVALRWSFGIFGVLALLWMAWRTLDVPNTQSATGILYVAVIGVFVGELAGALLSAATTFPL